MSNHFTSLVSEFLTKGVNGARVLGLRAGRKLTDMKGPAVTTPGFFDRYQRFFETSETTAFANRLNQRHRAIIGWSESLIKGKRVLDIASHDGRWSFAALKAGAAFVTGLEARDHLVQGAKDNLREYDISEDNFRFVKGDAFAAIDQIEPGSIDTAFCLGFFYHITDHMLLLSKIARLKPKNIILDTAIIADPRRVVLFQPEDPENESDAARTDAAQAMVLAGIPSKSALELMMSSFGWRFEFYDWHSAGIARWNHIEDYQEGTRVTVRITCPA